MKSICDTKVEPDIRITSMNMISNSFSNNSTNYNNNDDRPIGPDQNISLIIGIIGVILFSLLFLIACYASIIARNKYSKYMFLSACIYSILDLPRYVALIIQRAYINQTTYALHLLAGIFFFFSLSFACYLLHDAVDISKSISSPLKSLAEEKKFCLEVLLFDHKSFIIVNIIYDIIIIIDVIMCIQSDSLDLFFEGSLIYEICTYFEAGTILIYVGLTLYTIFNIMIII